MSELIRTIFIMSISGSIVAVLLFALKPLVRDRLPKSAQYYLWFTAIAALLVPVSVFIKLPAATETTPVIILPSNVVEHYVVTIEEVVARVNAIGTGEHELKSPHNAQTFAQADVPKPITDAMKFFVPYYPVIASAILIYHFIAYAVFTRKIRRDNKQADVDCAIPVCLNAKANTPMLIGLFKPVIVLPDCEYTDAQLRAVLLHEMTHLRRKDVLVKWLSVIACSVHCFNPIVWFVRLEIDRACELATDETVIRNLDAEGRQNYGDTLIYVATDSKTPRAVLSTTMCEEKKALKERLGAIMKSKKHTRLAVVLSAALLISVTLAACALGAGRADKNGLIEFEVVYSDVTANSFRADFKRGDIVYTGYIVDDMLQAAGGTRGKKQIGYAIGDFTGTVREGQKDEYKIYEREGYSIDEFIIVADDGFMNMTTIYVASAQTLYIPLERRDINRRDLGHISYNRLILKGNSTQ